MRLVRGAWRLLVGIKDALVLLLLLLFFGVLYAALSARPNPAIGNGALVLKFDGSIVEQPSAVGTGALIGGQPIPRQFRLRDVVSALNAAVGDSRVKAVVLDLDGFTGGGQVSLEDVGAALDRVRAAKKPVLAFATGYTDDGYALAAHASEIWLEPMGLALFAGPGGSHPYYKGLIDKLGVNAHIYRVGQYKSAVEPYMLGAQSPAAKQANEALAGALLLGWQTDIMKARPKARIASYVADPAAAAKGNLASAALQAGIVDHLGDRDSFIRHVATIVGPGRKNMDFAAIDLAAFVAAHPLPSDGKVGIVTVAGTIVDGEADAGTAGGDTIAALINRAIAGGTVKALVVRVDSPGGSALASERIRVALAEAKARGLPIVVSMSNVAASGGYWVATAGDKVFAEPSTITGSIGVFGIIPTFETALAKIGVTTDGVKTTPLSGQPDILGGTNAAFDTVVQRGVENTYGRFVSLVSAARHIPPGRVDEIGQGRVWDGGSARQLGLIDAFGGIDDAVAEAAKLAGFDPKAAHGIWLDKPPTWKEVLARQIADMNNKPDAADALSSLTRARMDEVSAALDQIMRLPEGATIQTRCMECPGASPAAGSAPPPRLLDLLLAWARL